MNKPILLASVLLLAGCASSTTTTQGTQASDAAATVLPSVQVVTTAYESVPQSTLCSSTVQAYAVNNIAPQSGGRIQQLKAEVGDFVAKGQILVEMDRVQLTQQKLQLSNAETELARLRQLYEQGGLSQSDYEAAELQYNVAKASYDNLEQNTILRSPITGVVTARNYDRGDMYAMAQPIYTVQQISPVKILVPISETDYTRVKKGDKVSLTADALPGKTFEGSVSRLYPTMDASTHTFNVEVLVPNNKRELRPGMYVRADVNFGDNRSVTVPDSAILKMQGAGTRTVFVINGEGVSEMRVVTLGRHFDGKYEILSGLEEGERVVYKGNSSLKAGVPVQIVQ